MAKKNEVTVGFPNPVQRETRQLCLRDIRKQLNGSITVTENSVNGSAIVVNLNGIEKARPVCESVLVKKCRNVDVTFAA